MMYNESMADNIDDILKNDSKHGGARKGAGRPEGSMNKATAEMKVAKKAFIERVNKNVDRLFNSQLDLALGEKYLMVITTTGDGKNKRRETTIVTDPDIIKQYLDSGEDSKFGEENEYYFISTKPSNNQALDSLLNRSFGKPTEKVDLTTGGEPLKALVQFVDDNNNTAS